jgi:tRNA(fMet)-specific endonuclease VapC
MLLLDTNHCSSILEGDTSVLQQMTERSATIAFVSVVTEGELRFMAEKSSNQKANLDRVNQLLLDMNVIPIDSEIAATYAELKLTIMHFFGPKEKLARRKITLARLGFQDNDLWIAATAVRYNLTLISADGDFGRMAEARPIPLESWLA